eukprot:gene15636-biopygen10542
MAVGAHQRFTVIVRYRHPSVKSSPVMPPPPSSLVTVIARYRYLPSHAPSVIPRYRYRPLPLSPLPLTLRYHSPAEAQGLHSAANAFPEKPPWDDG